MNLLQHLRDSVRRYPLVPVAVLAIVAAAAYVHCIVLPRRERFISAFALDAERAAHIKVQGEVVSVRAPVSATRGELKFRFRLKNPKFLNEDGSVIREIGGSLPVIWYSPRPKKAGFAPEQGAVFDLVGKIYVRRSVMDGRPKSLDDIFLISRARSTRVLDVRRDGPTGFLSRVRYSAAERITRGLGRMQNEKSLILAMTLGFRSDIPRRTMRTFRQAGTIHIFAISGLHVLLIAEIIAWGLGVFGISRKYWVIPLAPTLAAYVFLTGGQPSAMRAGLMATIYYAAPLFGRRSDGLNAIACTALILVPINPEIVTDLGFILSFSMVTGIVIFLPYVQPLLDRLFRPEAATEALAIDELAAGRLPFWKRQVFKARHIPLSLRIKCAKHIPVAITAALVSFPLTAHFFGFCTPYALLANIVVIPLAGYVMKFSAAGLALSCIHPVCAVPANLMAACLAWLMKEISFQTAHLPGAAPNLQFNTAMLAAWYVSLLLVCAALRRKEPRGGGVDF
jgi:ComEC/Rec2-related protein